MNTIKEVFRQIGNLFRWWVVVVPWEQAVRVRLGKYQTVLDCGIHLRVPFVDLVYKQSIRKRYITIPTQTVTTSDGKTLTVSGGLAYSIKDIARLYNSLHDAEDTLQLQAQGAVAKFVAGNLLSDVTPKAIEDRLPGVLDMERYGLGDVEACVTDYAVVKTYRLIQGEPKSWSNAPGLNTAIEDGKTP